MNPDRGYRKSNLPENAKRVFEGKIFDVYQWEQGLYDGTTGTFERLLRADTVIVFPVLEDKRIFLIDDEQPDRGAFITPPAGRLEEGETPEQGALRELKEETGLVPQTIEIFYTYKPFNKLDWIVHIFVAKGCKKVAEPTLDAGEKISPHPVSFEELINLVAVEGIRAEGFTELVLRAKLDPQKMEALKKKFLG